MKAPKILRQCVSSAKDSKKCDCCGEPIKKGTRYLRQDLKDPETGEKWVWRSHIECNLFAYYLPQECDRRGFTKEDILSLMNEKCKKKECFGCPYKEKESLCKANEGTRCIPYMNKWEDMQQRKRLWQ